MTKRHGAVEIRHDGYAFLYARISKDDKKKKDREREGCDSQLRRMHAVCDARDIPRDRRIEFVDNDISASEFGTKERAAYIALCDAIAHSQNCLLLAVEQQRLVRQLGEGEELAKLCVRTGIRMNLLSMGDMDLTSDAGDSMWILTLMMGRMESKGTSRRSRNKNADMRQQGVQDKGHQPTFGYSTTDYTVHDAGQKALLQTMIADVISGVKGPRDCVRLMTEHGYMSPRTGKPYSVPGMKYILTNPVYAGYVVHKGKIVRESTHILTIISKEEHQAVCDAVAERTRQHLEVASSAVTNTRVHVLTGLVRCGRCGAVCYSGTESGHQVWRCSGRAQGWCGGVQRQYAMVAAMADAAIRDMLTQAHVTAVEATETDPARVELEGEIQTLEGRLADVRKLFSDPACRMAPEDYYATCQDLRDQITTRRGRLTSMVRAAGRTLPPDALATWTDESPENLGTRRAMAAMLIDSIVILPVGNVGRRGAPPESVQIYPANGRGVAPGIAEIPGESNTEELAS